MTDQLDAIRARHTGRIRQHRISRLHDDIGALLDLLKTQQAKLDASKQLICTAQEKNHQAIGNWGACPICSAGNDPVDDDGNPVDYEDATQYHCNHDEDCLISTLDLVGVLLDG